MQDSRSTGKALTDGAKQQEVLRAGEDESSRSGVAVHRPLYVREEIGCPLDFVQNHRPRMIGQEPPWIFEGECKDVGLFESDVLVVAKGLSRKSRLARLSGAGQCRDGILRVYLLEDGLEVTSDHLHRLMIEYLIYTTRARFAASAEDDRKDARSHLRGSGEDAPEIEPEWREPLPVPKTSI